jgi:hypothetical protein
MEPAELLFYLPENDRSGGAIGYGPNKGDVLTGVGGGHNTTAMKEAQILGKAVVRLARKMRGRGTELDVWGRRGV